MEVNMEKQYSLCLLLLCYLNFSLEAQWEARTNGLPATFDATFIDAIDTKVTVANVSSGLGDLYRTLDGGLHWENIGCPPQDAVLTLSAVDSLRIWIATSKARIYATSDGGRIWVKQYVDSSKTTFINYIKMFDAQNGIVMADALTSSLPPVFLRTTNGGAIWKSMNDSTIGGYSSGQWSMLSFLSPDTGYFFSMGDTAVSKLYKTFDGGKTWKKTNYPARVAFCVKFSTERIGMVGFVGYIRRTRDGGDTWEQYSYPSTSLVMDIEFMKNDPSKVWLLTQGELFYSSDTGRTWKLNVGLSKICDDVNFPDTTHGWIVGQNIVLYTDNPLPVGVLRQKEGSVPLDIMLAQNYPNPFNPSTNIEFSLPIRCRVELTIYDVLGRVVAALKREELPRGTSILSVPGDHLPSGMYIYSLVATSIDANRPAVFRQSRKMLLTK
jgi:photosystem II stability/assembly factor-like uncharacterized protein